MLPNVVTPTMYYLDTPPHALCIGTWHAAASHCMDAHHHACTRAEDAIRPYTASSMVRASMVYCYEDRMVWHTYHSSVHKTTHS